MKVSIGEAPKVFHPITVVIETAEEANMLRSLLAPLNSQQAKELWGVDIEEDASYKLFCVLDDALEPLGINMASFNATI